MHKVRYIVDFTPALEFTFSSQLQVVCYFNFLIILWCSSSNRGHMHDMYSYVPLFHLLFGHMHDM
jgi:hypothetical protein